jgi:hypothetical protein
VLTVVVTVIVFGSGMSRFDTGDPATPGVQIASALVRVFAYPVLPMLAQPPLTMQPSGIPGEHRVFGRILGQHLGEVEFMTGTRRLREATP